MIQQEVEKQGISTISITHLPELSEKVGVPRALHVRFPLGRSFGGAGRKGWQKTIVTDMIHGIETITEAKTIQALPYKWKNAK